MHLAPILSKAAGVAYSLFALTTRINNSDRSIQVRELVMRRYGQANPQAVAFQLVLAGLLVLE